jgi:hypothetical protein
MIDAKIQACKAAICACPLGQMISASQTVGNTFLGGLLCPPCCPPVKASDLAKPSDTAAGACARIKAEELDAPNRRDAVRCLAYANCRWYPEAEAALINSLRTDRNECVRLEAARVMGTGCCCTRKVIEALTITVAGSTRDGNPPEISPRVMAEAYITLQKCLQCYHEEVDAPKRPESPEKPVPPAAPGAAPTALLTDPDTFIRPVAWSPTPAMAVPRMPTAVVVPAAPQSAPTMGTVEEARQVLTQVRPVMQERVGLQSGKRGLFQVVAYAWKNPSPPSNPEAEQQARDKVAQAFAPPQQTPEPPVSPDTPRPATGLLAHFFNK